MPLHGCGGSPDPTRRRAGCAHAMTVRPLANGLTTGLIDPGTGTPTRSGRTFTERTERAVRGADQVTDTATICPACGFPMVGPNQCQYCRARLVLELRCVRRQKRAQSRTKEGHHATTTRLARSPAVDPRGRSRACRSGAVCDGHPATAGHPYGDAR